MNFVIRGRFVAIKGRHEMLYYIEREGERERKSVILDPYRTSGQYDRNLSFTCTTENKVIRSGFTISSRMKGRTEPREHWRRNAAARSAKTTVFAGSEQPLCDSRFTRARSLFERFWNDAVQLAYSCNFANIFFSFDATFLDYYTNVKSARELLKEKQRKRRRGPRAKIFVSRLEFTQDTYCISNEKTPKRKLSAKVYPYEFKNYSTVCRTIVLQHLHKDHVQKRTGNCPGSTAYRNKIEENLENFEIYSLCVGRMVYERLYLNVSISFLRCCNK